jgi:hypothetical protein
MANNNINLGEIVVIFSFALTDIGYDASAAGRTGVLFF